VLEIRVDLDPSVRRGKALYEVCWIVDDVPRHDRGAGCASRANHVRVVRIWQRLCDGFRLYEPGMRADEVHDSLGLLGLRATQDQNVPVLR